MRRLDSRTTALAAALLLAACPALAACGDDGGGSETDTAAVTDTVAPGDTGGDATVADTGDGDAADTQVGDAADAADTVAPPAPVAWPGWDDATVYFVITDRFFNGDPTNDHAYGRESDGDKEIATFHGGDLAGLTAKVDAGYFDDLGVSAIWITAPYEQVHGWVSGAGIKHYAYHGYFALDYTKVDGNMGTEDDLRAFVDKAHEHGIRVVLDVVMNHPGYATAQDLSELGVDVLLPGWEDATPADLYDYIDFEDPDFANWWGTKWIRAELGGGYPAPGPAPLKNNLDYLPDFRTEVLTTGIGLPPMYAHKPDTRAVDVPEYGVRSYLVAWLTDWVRRFGVDGFRCDTAKHVELESWAALKTAADAALKAWRAENPDKAFPDADYADTDAPFWMTGEVFPHGVAKDGYFQSGFDSLINFDYQDEAAAALASPVAIDATWASMAAAINTDPDFNVLSYLSSHDTSLFYEKSAGKDDAKQRLAGSLLLLAPGAVQIFYGDENGRTYGTASTDASHKTRSDYVWGDKPALLAHWQKVGLFRKRHRAVGAGAHAKLADAPYTFKRTLDDDVVYVVLGASGTTSVDVSADFADGATLRDAYTGATATVASGSVAFAAVNGAPILIEPAN